MPKRTQEQLDQRRRQIMQAALSCAARKGLHKTTMRDICREAELSAGAVYNYYSSKEEILAAAAAASRTAHREVLEEISGRASAQQSLVALFGFLFDSLQGEAFRQLGSVDADILAEAQRNPEIREIVEQEQQDLEESIAAIFSKGQEREQVSDEIDPVAVAKTVVALSNGIKLHLLVHGEEEISGFRRTIQQLFFGSLWSRSRE